MTWETEESSEVHSQSQVTADTYGFGNDAAIIFSDDPERAYFESMLNGDDSLIGESTVDELLEERQRGMGGLSSLQLSRAGGEQQEGSLYSLRTDDDTVGRIEPDQKARGWFARKRESEAQTRKQQQASRPSPAMEPAPSPAALALKSPVSGLSPDRAGKGLPQQDMAVPNPDLVPKPGATERVIPGFIFVTNGHSSAVSTKQSQKKGKNGSEPSHDREQKKMMFCKAGLLCLMIGLIVGIVMLSLVLTKSRNDDPKGNSGPDFDPPTAVPVTESGAPTPAPVEPTSPQTGEPTAAAPEAPTSAPVVVVHPTASPSQPPTVDILEQTLDELVNIYPVSAPGLDDITSPQFLALEWVVEEWLASNGNLRRKLESMVDSRFIQRWVLAVFYFSTGGTTSWRSDLGWLDFPEECQWTRITCNEGGVVTEILIDNNRLKGDLPLELGYLTESFTKLSLNGNDLTGPLPSTLGLLVGLERLTIKSNDLVGDIPAEFGQLVNLEFLALSRNKLDGPIPDEIGAMHKLRTLDLAINDLTGDIPAEIGDLKKLEYVALGSNDLSGAVPRQLGDLPLLTHLLVEKTDLTGAIPNQLCQQGVNELKADCREVDCPCCTNCCIDGSGCSGPTMSPTKSPTPQPTVRRTRSPTQPPTGQPTAEPTSEPTKKDTPQPTAEPTGRDTSQPTAEPTEGDTARPTAMPTSAPTPVAVTDSPTSNPTDAPVTSETDRPTQAPTPAPTRAAPVTDNPTAAPTFCTGVINTDRSCYEQNDVIIVTFENCNALADDWVGVYPAGDDPNNLGEPVANNAWVWTNGQDNPTSPVSSGQVVFGPVSGRGSFEIMLARNGDQPPYRGYAVTAAFTLTEGVCP